MMLQYPYPRKLSTPHSSPAPLAQAPCYLSPALILGIWVKTLSPVPQALISQTMLSQCIPTIHVHCHNLESKSSIPIHLLGFSAIGLQALWQMQLPRHLQPPANRWLPALLTKHPAIISYFANRWLPGLCDKTPCHHPTSATNGCLTSVRQHPEKAYHLCTCRTHVQQFALHIHKGRGSTPSGCWGLLCQWLKQLLLTHASRS
jgi:hypothetical protein